MIDMETVDCPLCGGADWMPVAAAEDPDAAPPRPVYSVVRCRACGLCITNPRPSAEEIGRFYAVDYQPHRIAPTRTNGNGFDVFLARLRSHIRPNYERGDFPAIGQKRLLDFGCGGGAFLLQMKERGWDAAGLDFSADTVKRLRGELGLNVLAGTLPHPELQPESFDLITFWHSLEHVHRPLEVLNEAQRLLAPGGWILAAVPNVESLSFRWLGADWFGLDVPRHVTHFSPATMRKTLEKAGFRVLKKQNIRHSQWLRNSLERARQNGRLRRNCAWLRSKLASSAFTRYQQAVGRADSFLMIAEKALR
jgi:2-polyprenyl-3-methyl-5-hydroxy-6-metoxy-1,4-benzoquinol methylase